MLRQHPIISEADPRDGPEARNLWQPNVGWRRVEAVVRVAARLRRLRMERGRANPGPTAACPVLFINSQ